MAKRYDDFDDLNLSEFDYETDEEFSLESILAEFGSGSNDKKETDGKDAADPVDDIIKDITRETARQVDSQPAELINTFVPPAELEKPSFDTMVLPKTEHKTELKTEQKTESDVQKTQAFEPVEEPTRRLNFFDKIRQRGDDDEEEQESAEEVTASKPEKRKTLFGRRNKETDDELEEPIEEYEDASSEPEEEEENDHYGLVGRLSEFLSKKRTSVFEDDDGEENDVDGERFSYNDLPYEPEEEPDYKSEVSRFANGLASLAVRELVILGLSVLMLLFTVLFEGGANVPFGIGKDQLMLSGVLVIMQLIVMGLGIEVVISGVSDILALRMGAESLLTVAGFFSVIDGIVMILSEDVSKGLPFSTAIAFAFYFAVFGRKSYRLAMAETLRMTAVTATPSAVVSDVQSIEDRSILKKVRSGLNGFWRMATASDITEDAYSLAAPILLVFALIFAFLSTVFRDRPDAFFHAFSSLLAICTSFSACMAYSYPFRLFSKKTRNQGGAIAGWGGVCEICKADGALITDTDIFPRGTVALTGVKIFEGVQSKKAIGYTGSLIMMSNSGLSGIFEEFMKSKSVARSNVEKFTYYEGGGLGGSIFGENVLVGNSGFMNLMGIRIPNGVYEQHAVYTAVNNSLVAVFTVSYSPANSVRGAIISLLKSHVSMLFAAKDANLTPDMLQKRFKVSVDGIEYIPVEDCYKITEDEAPHSGDAFAVVCRAGLGPFAAVIANAKKLRILSMLTTVISVASSFIGLLYIFFLCWSGSFLVNTVLNVLLYLSIVQGIVYLLIYLLTRK